MLETLPSRPLKTGSRQIRADRRARGYIWCLVFMLLYNWYGGKQYIYARDTIKQALENRIKENQSRQASPRLHLVSGFYVAVQLVWREMGME